VIVAHCQENRENREDVGRYEKHAVNLLLIDVRLKKVQYETIIFMHKDVSKRSRNLIYVILVLLLFIGVEFNCAIPHR